MANKQEHKPTEEQRNRDAEALSLMRRRQKAMREAQARANSLARAQAAAQAQAAAKAKAEARVRELLRAERGEETEADEADSLSVRATAEEGREAVEIPVNGSHQVALAEEEPVTDPVVHEKEPDELEYAIEIHDLYKSYGTKQVLKGLNLTVYPGELFGFIGKNGIGKSTTIDCMIGAKRFNGGNITVGGYDVRREAVDVKASYGYVASEPTCYEVMTGYDYLEFVASIYHLSETEFQSNHKYLCNRLQLKEEDLAHHISGYSHGMKQKLCLVASLLHNPNIWILDEPTVGLDIMAQEELKKMMREYANHGKTVFVTSHNIELVSAICDRVAIINDGVVQVVYDLKKDPKKREQLPGLFLKIYGG